MRLLLLNILTNALDRNWVNSIGRCNTSTQGVFMGRTGVCWDNAAAESFFAKLKNEMYYRYRFTTQARARFAVAEYIEVFYNPKRLHSTLGYQTPSEVLAHSYAATFEA